LPILPVRISRISFNCKIKHLIASINFFDFPLPPTLARVSLKPIRYDYWS
jgi:hypothetical protein